MKLPQHHCVYLAIFGAARGTEADFCTLQTKHDESPNRHKPATTSHALFSFTPESEDLLTQVSHASRDPSTLEILLSVKKSKKKVRRCWSKSEMDRSGEVSAAGNENKWSCVWVWKQICDGNLSKHESFLKACRPASYGCQNYKRVSLINHTLFTTAAKCCHN